MKPSSEEINAVKIITSTTDLISPLITRHFNESIEISTKSSNFPKKLKFADISLVHEKNNRHEKEYDIRE